MPFNLFKVNETCTVPTTTCLRHKYFLSSYMIYDKVRHYIIVQMQLTVLYSAQLNKRRSIIILSDEKMGLKD